MHNYHWQLFGYNLNVKLTQCSQNIAYHCSVLFPPQFFQIWCLLDFSPFLKTTHMWHLVSLPENCLMSSEIAYSKQNNFFHRNSNSIGNWFECDSTVGYHTATKCCMCHDSTNFIVITSQLEWGWNDFFFFYQIWISFKISFEKWKLDMF